MTNWICRGPWTNKANCRRRQVGRGRRAWDGDDCAKQSQLPEAGHRGGVRWHQAGRGRKGEGRGAIVRNKANFHQAGDRPGFLPCSSPRRPPAFALRYAGAQIPCRGEGGLYNGLPQKQLDGSWLCVREAGLSWCER
jgi:hypothetical protein